MEEPVRSRPRHFAPVVGMQTWINREDGRTTSTGSQGRRGSRAPRRVAQEGLRRTVMTCRVGEDAQETLTLYGKTLLPDAWGPLANVPGGRLRGRLGRLGPTDPAGRPSLRGRPTGRLILGGALGSMGFLPLPLGRPGRRLTGWSEGGAPSTGGWAGGGGGGGGPMTICMLWFCSSPGLGTCWGCWGC